MQLVLTNPNRTRIGYQLAVLSFLTLRTAIDFLRDIREIQPRYYLRCAFVFTSSLVTAPLRILETLLYRRAVERQPLDPAPIFIVGHWRSGTTHLHNLMAQDPNLGFLSMYQAILPESSLVAERFLKPILSWLVPLVRPMDDMVWPLDSPQEEEIPLSKVHAQGFYARLLFPHTLSAAVDEQVLLRGASKQAIARWKRHYLSVLRKAAFRSQGRRLVLKNPVNTGRIPLLLEMFPKAKFIFVHRSPYEVFLSSRRLHERLLDIVRLHDCDRALAERNVLEIYPRMMRRYLEERAQIPEGQLVEIGFEDLARAPRATLQHIYETLDLPGFRTAEPALKAYIETQAGYEPAEYAFDRATIEKVEGAWGFAFDALGYQRVSAQAATPRPISSSMRPRPANRASSERQPLRVARA